MGFQVRVLPVISCLLFSFLATPASAELGLCKAGNHDARKREYRSDITGCKADCGQYDGGCVQSDQYLYFLFGITLSHVGTACYCDRLYYYLPVKEKAKLPSNIRQAVSDPGLHSITELDANELDLLDLGGLQAYVVEVNRARPSNE